MSLYSAPTPITASQVREIVHWALSEPCPDVSRALLGKRVPADALNDVGETFFHDRCEIIEALILHGADPNAPCVNGSSALEWACVYGAQGCLQMLLKHGANVSGLQSEEGAALSWVMDDWRVNPAEEIGKDAHRAIRARKRSMSQLLLDAGAKLDGVSLENETPLFVAVRNGVAEDVVFLLDAGANIHHRAGSTEITPLISAAMHGRVDMVCILLERGAHIDDTDIGGRDAMAHAKEMGYPEVVEALRAHLHLRALEGDNALPHSGHKVRL